MAIALSRYCGLQDTVTRLSRRDEILRREQGGKDAQNYKVPLARLKLRDWVEVLVHRRRPCYSIHGSALSVKKYMSDEEWADYFTFCFERNPWDKVISYYFWKYREEPRPDLDHFLFSEEIREVSCWDLYTDSDDVIVDRVYRYEELAGALSEITERCRLPEELVLPKAKSGLRGDSRHYRDALNLDQRRRVEDVFEKEIERFGYEW